MPRGPSSAGAPIGFTRITRGVASPPATAAATTIEPNEWPRMTAPGATAAANAAQPVGVGREVVPAARQRRRLAEPGQVGRDDPDIGQVRDDRLEPVMLAAEAVHGDDRRLGVRGSVHPVRGRRPPSTSTSRRSTGIASSERGVGIGDGHPSSLRVAAAAERLDAAMSEAAHTVSGMEATATRAARRLFDDAPSGRAWSACSISRRPASTSTRDRIVTAHVGLLDAARRGRSAPATGSPTPASTIPEGATAVHGITTEHARARRAPRPARSSREVVDSAAGAAGCRHPGRRLQRAVRLLAAQARGAAPRRRADPRPVAGHRSARRRQGVRPLAARQAHARGGRRALRRAARRRARGIGRRRRRGAGRAGARRSGSRRGCPPSADELHTRQIAWARAQAASLTEYFIQIGRLDPEDRLDGSWPIR